jgi:hypothetical protein
LIFTTLTECLKIDLKEQRAAMQSLGFEAKSDYFLMISDLDKNKSGSID